MLCSNPSSLGIYTLSSATRTSSVSDAMAVESDHVRGFVLQLVREFLSASGLEQTASTLEHELEDREIPDPGPAVWFDMQQRCRAAMETRGSSKPAMHSTHSTLEQLVAFCAELASAPRHQAAAGPVTVSVSPMTNSRSSFSLMDAVAQARSPVTRPSQKRIRMQQQLQHKPPSPTGSVKATGCQAGSRPATPASPTARTIGSAKSSGRDRTTPSEGSSRPSSSMRLSKPRSAGSRVAGSEDEGDDDPVDAASSSPSTSAPSSPSASRPASSTSTARTHSAKQQPSPTLRPPSAKAASPSKTISLSRKKRRSPRHRRPKDKAKVAASTTHPASPWGNTALHANGHFGGSHTNVGVHPGFDGAAPMAETALIRAHDARLQHDLSCVRFVDRELRQLRLQAIQAPPSVERPSQVEGDVYERELLLERYGFSKRVECALCQFPFLLANLPHRVSFKCIMDVHAAWHFVPPDRDAAAKYKPPLCYDAVRVCRLCGPIVFQYSSQPPEAQAMAKSRSVGALPSSKTRGSAATNAASPSFCSDPYALPPLFGDDVMDEETVCGGGGGGDNKRPVYVVGSDGVRRSEGGSVVVLDSPAKAIVYMNQTDTTAFMSSKEWEIINPQRSSIRQVMEQSVRVSTK